MTSPAVSIIAPALCEAANIPILARRVAAALSGRAYELIIVDDDSRDGTVEVCDALVAEGLPVHLIVRRDRCEGLSGAVLTGLRAARGETLVVLDADLQHPPERIPALLRAIEEDGVEFALGSRYIAGGGVADQWSSLRRLNSRAATILASPFARGVRDPMSGFFALPRRVYERGRYVAPTGYKIALELMCKCRASPIREVPILFALRERGQSKLSLKEQVRYLEHLSRLYDFAFPRIVPAVKFLITVAGALLIAFCVLASLTKLNAGGPWWATTIAYACGTLVPAVFHYRYVRRQRAYLIRATPWRDFWICSVAEWAAVSIVAVYVSKRIQGPTPAEVLLLPFAAGTVFRYFLRKELLLDVRGLRFVPSYGERLAGVARRHDDADRLHSTPR